MVVSVDISGVLEERLRRLVELGLFASVSEAVREGVRLLFKELDLRSIALTIYTTRKASLHYACYFSGESCPVMIDYMLDRGVQPLLGIPSRPEPPEELRLLLDPASLFVVYNSLLGEVLARLQERTGIELLVSPEEEPYVQVLEARALYKGLLRRSLRLRTLNACARTRPKLNEKDVMVDSMERNSLVTSLTCGVTLVSPDVRFREYVLLNGGKVRPLLSLVEMAMQEEVIEGDEAGDLVMSLRSIPMVVPHEYRSYG